MPAYNPPPQVLFSPVTNYYQGKAIRQQLAAGEQDMELKQAQIDSIPAQRAADAAKLKATQDKAAREVAQELRAVDADKRARLYEAGKASLAYFEENPDDEVGATEQFALAYGDGAQDIMPGGDSRISFQEAKTLVAAQDYEADGGSSYSQAHYIDPLGQAVQGAFNTSTGEYSPSPNSPIAPQAGQADLGSGVNTSGQSKNTIEFQDATIGAVGAVQLGTEMLISSKENPEALGVPGGFMRWGANFVSGAQALADWAGMDYKPGTNVERDTELQGAGYGAFDYSQVNVDKLGVSGAEAEKFRAGVYGIAFAAAVAEQGTRPTDKDIQQFIDQIGGRATSAQSFRETIAQFMRRQDRRLKTIAGVKGISETDMDAAFSQWTPAYQSFMETYAKTTGRRVATHPETGEKMIEMRPDEWESF